MESVTVVSLKSILLGLTGDFFLMEIYTFFITVQVTWQFDLFYNVILPNESFCTHYLDFGEFKLKPSCGGLHSR